MAFTHEVYTGGCDIDAGYFRFRLPSIWLFSNSGIIAIVFYRILSYLHNSKEP